MWHWIANLATPDVMTFPGSGITALWGSRSDDLWALGLRNGDGMSMHWDGAGWGTPITIAGAWFFDAWGSGPDDIWAVGTLATSQTGRFARKIGPSWSSPMPATGAH